MKEMKHILNQRGLNEFICSDSRNHRHNGGVPWVRRGMDEIPLAPGIQERGPGWIFDGMGEVMVLDIKYKRISDLIPYAMNSRTHSDSQVNQIALSIKEFGFTNPVLIDEQGGIIAGHGRLMAANKLSMHEVPTITIKGLTEAQKKAYVIADNKLALNAGWDEELLKIEIESLQDVEFDIDLLGFSADEISGLLDITTCSDEYYTDVTDSINEEEVTIKITCTQDDLIEVTNHIEKLKNIKIEIVDE